MSDRKLTILGLSAVILAAIAVTLSCLSAPKPYVPYGQTCLIQGLDTGKIGSIELSAGTGKVSLKRTGSTFVVAQKDNYPADTAVINELLTACLDIRTIEHRTADPQNHSDLGVTDDKAACTVRFLDAEDKPITGVIISKPCQETPGAFVRLISSNDVYLTDNSPALGADPMDYIDKKLFNIEREKIKSVTVASAQQSYTLQTADQDDNITLIDIPAGKKLKTAESRQVFYALTNLDFEDVLKADTFDTAFDQTCTCRLSDSTVYTISLAKKDNALFARCSVEFIDKAPVEKEKRVESEDELKAKEAKLLARDAAAAFADKHSGWVYRIRQFRVPAFSKKLEDLLEDEKPAPTQPAAPSPGPAEMNGT